MTMVATTATMVAPTIEPTFEDEPFDFLANGTPVPKADRSNKVMTKNDTS